MAAQERHGLLNFGALRRGEQIKSGFDLADEPAGVGDLGLGRERLVAGPVLQILGGEQFITVA